ncbi:MAG: H-NS family nucleoid-associated regulatory protein (plasmid) [Burkholderia sp.]|nr:MAG: hypothetical protein E5299_01974 [Burkholderia gladioli]
MSSEKRGKPRGSKKETKPPVTPRTIQFVPLDPEKMPRGRPRYRDPANPFNTWGGQGKRPDWLRKYLEEGRELADFEIRDED